MANEKIATGTAREHLKDGGKELVRVKWKKQGEKGNLQRCGKGKRKGMPQNTEKAAARAVTAHSSRFGCSREL